MTRLVLLHYFGWQSIESMVGWWSGYQMGVLSSELQQNDYVWMIERCTCDLANTHQHDLMVRQPKPSRHTCSTWLTNGVSDKRNTCDWSLFDRGDACMTMNLTQCVSATNAFIANKTSTHGAKTLSIARTWSQAWLWDQYANLGEMIKQGGCEDSHELMEWTWVCVTINWNSQGRLWNWVQAKILEGGCSRYNTWRHTGRTPASLLWFIDSTGPWSFREYWIIVRVTPVSPLTPWTYIVHLLPTQSNTINSLALSQCFEFRKGSLARELNIFRV